MRRAARVAGAALLVAFAGSAVWGPGSARAAISYVGSKSAATAAGTTLTIAQPSGIASGQVLIATVNASGTGTITAPTGWTLIQNTVTTQRQTSYYHVTTSSEPGSYAWSLGSTRAASGGIIAYSGVNTTVPIDASASSSGTSGNAIAPSVTTNAAGDVVIAAVSFGSIIVNPVNPGAGTTERYDTASLLIGATETEAADFIQSTAGATATKTATPLVSAPWIAQTIALNVATNAALSVAATASPSFSASLPAGDQTPTYTLPLTVQDTRTGAAAGWKLTITSTPLTSDTHSLATTASSVTGVTSTCLGGAICVTPTNAITYPFSVPAGAGPPTAVKLFNAAAGTGTGVFSIVPTVKVSVPANSYAGTYTSTITVAVVTGP